MQIPIVASQDRKGNRVRAVSLAPTVNQVPKVRAALRVNRVNRANRDPKTRAAPRAKVAALVVDKAEVRAVPADKAAAAVVLAVVVAGDKRLPQA